ncbi:MAG: DUF937 domain-containing protein [Rhodothermales bacterium]|nr:DUF937 domain-containing protein [Rhodothermales bacterium]
MNLLSSVLQNGAVLQQMAKQLNLDPNQVQSAVTHMIPALTRGIQKNASSPGGLEGLLGALQKGSHSQYVEKPNLLGQAETINDGNAILGHILGSKDVSRNVAGHAAQQTGLDAGILKKMLPMLATVVMGALSKQTSNAGLLEGLAGAAMGGGNSGGNSGGGGLLGGLLKGLTGGGQPQQKAAGNPALDMLGSFLDADKDGSVMDDLLGMAKKLF